VREKRKGGERERERDVTDKIAPNIINIKNVTWGVEWRVYHIWWSMYHYSLLMI